MIPYILAAVGGYLIYDSTRKSPNPLSNPYNILADGGEVKKYKDFEDFSMGVSHKKNQVVLIDGKRYVVSKVIGSSSGDRVDLLGIDAENRNDGVRLLVDPSGGILKQEEFAKGGMMAKGGKLSIEDKVRLAQIEREIKEQQKTIEEFEEDDDETEYNRFGDRFGNPSPLSFNQLVVVEAEKNLEKLQEERKNLLKDKKMASGGYMADGGMMAKGGKVKKKWIQEALSGGDNKGALRRTAKRKGLLKGDENLSATDLKKLQKMGGTTAKRAHLAETLRKFEDGGNKV